MSYLGKAVLIGRGKNGWHADYLGDKEPLSGGGSSQSTSSSSGGSLEEYCKDAPDGTPVYDADASPTGDFAHFIISGPMVSSSLQPGEVKKFGQEEKHVVAGAPQTYGHTLLGMLPYLKGAFSAVGVLAMTDLGSCDSVAVDVWVTMLREKVPGVRFGTVQGGKVVWEE